MECIRLGTSELTVSRISLGCMRLSDEREAALATIQAALDEGINFFDHANIYGGGSKEEVFAHVWAQHPALRQKILLQSKCGIRFGGDPVPDAPGRYDFSYEHIIQSVEGSLRRLQTDYLDVLLLHRPDPLVEPEEVARAFDELHAAGKVRWFGVSNHTAAQIEFLKTAVTQPLIANQVQLSVVHNQLFSDGVVFNQNDLGVHSRAEGTVEYCRTHHITLQAWSPLAAGNVTGKPIDPDNQRYLETAAVVAELADEKGVSKTAILVAWLLRHPAQIQPIIGTTSVERVRESCQALDFALTREEWYRLFVAGRGGRMP